MTYVALSPKVQLASSPHRRGHQLWAAEIYVNGRLLDQTAWADSPAQASSDGRTLARSWAQLCRWVPDGQLIDLIRPDPAPEAA